MKTRQWRGVVTAILVATLIGVALLPIQGALAELVQREEAGQMILESHQTLQDQTGGSWQVVAQRRFENDSATSFCLRLVGPASTADILRDRPLRLQLASGQWLEAPDNSCDFFPNASPAPHVAQYDLRAGTSPLIATTSLRLSVPGQNETTYQLEVPNDVLEEWQTVAACATLFCDPN
jgi:hypothetical protein